MSKKVKFKKLSYAAYTLLGSNVDPGTIYFILDKPLIFVGETQYGVTLDASKHLINSVQFTKSGKLVYTILGSSEIKEVPGLGYATEDNGGLMSPEHVKQLNRLSTLTENIPSEVTDLTEFIEQTVVEEAELTWTDVNAKKN